MFAQTLKCVNLCVIHCHLSSDRDFSCSQDNGEQTELEWCECWWMGVFWTAGPLWGIVSQWSLAPLSGVPPHHKQQLRSDHWGGMWTPAHKIPSVMFLSLALSLSVSLLMNGGSRFEPACPRECLARLVKTHRFFNKTRDVFFNGFPTHSLGFCFF